MIELVELWVQHASKSMFQGKASKIYCRLVRQFFAPRLYRQIFDSVLPDQELDAHAASWAALVGNRYGLVTVDMPDLAPGNSQCLCNAMQTNELGCGNKPGMLHPTAAGNLLRSTTNRISASSDSALLLELNQFPFPSHAL